MPAELAVVLLEKAFELAAVLAAGVAGRTVDPAAVPGQPALGLGVHVLAVAQVEHLALQLGLGLAARAPPADLASEHRLHRHACAAVGKVARIIHDNLDRLRRPGYGHPKWQQVDLDADLVSWERSKCAEDGLNGPQGYVLAAEAAEEDCDAEDNAIRRKLCLVKKQMRQQAEQPVASAGAM